MRYLSIDLEATGLEKDALIIEFAAVPMDTETRQVEQSLTFHHYVHCPSFADLKPKLNDWVIKNNEKLITKAHQEGLSLSEFKKEFATYLTSSPMNAYFAEAKAKDKGKITLFGKSMNAIDLPFLKRDLGHDFMDQHFNHKVMDLSSFAFGLIDLKLMPAGTDAGSELMKYFQMGAVAHTALEDAVNTAILYFKLLDRFTAITTSATSTVKGPEGKDQ